MGLVDWGDVGGRGVGGCVAVEGGQVGVVVPIGGLALEVALVELLDLFNRGSLSGQLVLAGGLL